MNFLYLFTTHFVTRVGLQFLTIKSNSIKVTCPYALIKPHSTKNSSQHVWKTY